MTNLPPSAASLRGAVDLSSLVNPAPPAAPAASGGGATSLVVEATDATFTSILELSNSVPVLVEFYGQGVQPALTALVREFGGKFVLATIDGTKNPQLVQAFQVTEVPTVAAVIAGRPLQLFAGMPAEEEIRQVLAQVLEVAAQQNVTGTVPVADENGEQPEPVEEPLPPHHQEAYDAIEAGDYAAAIAEYQTAIAQNPRDFLAVAGLAQVSLLFRLQGRTADEIRSAAASAPSDVEAQLAVADLDVSGGHADDAFGRLLDLFPTLDADGKNAVRTRLLEHFEVVGAEDPRVIAARRRLTALLY